MIYLVRNKKRMTSWLDDGRNPCKLPCARAGLWPLSVRARFKQGGDWGSHGRKKPDKKRSRELRGEWLGAGMMKRLLLTHHLLFTGDIIEATAHNEGRTCDTYWGIVLCPLSQLLGVKTSLSLITGVTFPSKKLQSVIGRAVDSLVTCEQTTLGTWGQGFLWDGETKDSAGLKNNIKGW